MDVRGQFGKAVQPSMLTFRFDSWMVDFSSLTASFDFDDLNAFRFDAVGVSFDASAVTFDAGVSADPGPPISFRFDATLIGLDRTDARFDARA